MYVISTCVVAGMLYGAILMMEFRMLECVKCYRASWVYLELLGKKVIQTRVIRDY
jgi:hypothetical protein